MEKYTKILSSLTSDQKIDFLEKVLLSSKDLQSQFVKYFTNDLKEKISLAFNFNDKVKEMASEYQETLEAMDLEPDYDRYHHRHDRYYEEWEMGQEAVEEVVDELFDIIKADLIIQISQGNIELVMAQLTGLLIACYESEIEDEYDNLGDPQDYFVNCLQEIEKDLEVEINRTILNSKAISETIINTMLCFKSGEANQFSTKIHDLIMTCLLNNNTESCADVYAVCKQNIEYTQLFPNTYLQATHFANAETWVSEAEKLCSLDIKVASDLLVYQQDEDKIGFHKNAKTLFLIFNNQLVNIIANGMNDEYDIEFSKKVLSYKINAQKKIDDYKRLACLLSTNEKLDFINSIKNNFSHKFYIEILETENMHSEILDYSKIYNGNLSNLASIMHSIINKYPSECFLIVKPKILSLLENNMGRNYYHEVAVLIRFLLSSTSNTIAVNDLIEELCRIYSRRPALRDELRQQGLLKK
ncbi:MAG: hypothetical protein Q7U47_10035 [Paludibacter sp.]|nr:hypothetical protein [Paludibacter sp.]